MFLELKFRGPSSESIFIVFNIVFDPENYNLVTYVVWMFTSFSSFFMATHDLSSLGRFFPEAGLRESRSDTRQTMVQIPG